MESDELNIPSTNNDPHYRYRMPRIQTTIQGSGNGIKTKWINLADVANALKVPIDYPMRFIGKELATNVDIKPNNYLLNGKHESSKMQEILDKFINKYVLCPKCKLPEIYGKIKAKKGEIKCTCRSCGVKSNLDVRHDFASYIIKNPPPYDDDEIKVGEKKPTGAKLDKKMIKNLKQCCINMPSLIKDDLSSEENLSKIKEFINGFGFPSELKLFCFCQGIIPPKVYTKAFEHRLPIIKQYILDESKGNYSQSLYYFIVGLEDLMFNRQKGENEKYLSSVLYYFYDKDILSEEFWKMLVSGEIKSDFRPMLFSEELESKFLKAAAEFSDFIENGKYEGEEESEKAEEKGEKKAGEKSEEREKEVKSEEKKEEKNEKKEEKTKTEEKLGEKKKKKKGKKKKKIEGEDELEDKKEEKEGKEKEKEKTKGAEDEIDIDNI